MPCKHMPDSDATGDTGRDKTSLCGWCLPDEEAQIAACVHRTKATLDSKATSEACRLHVPQTVSFACCVSGIDEITFH